MKKIVFMFIIVIGCLITCSAKNVDRVGFSNYIPEIKINTENEIIKPELNCVLKLNNSEVETESGSITQWSQNNYFTSNKKSYTNNELKKCFDMSVYLEVISQYAGYVPEISDVIYQQPYRVFIFTDETAYVITGQNEVWNDSRDDLNCTIFKVWREQYQQEQAISLYVNNQIIDGVAYICEDSVMIPLRLVFEAFNISVEWNQHEQTVLLDKTITLKTDDKKNICIAYFEDKQDLNIQISPWTTWASYCKKNDRIYISDITFNYLGEMFNFEVKRQGVNSVFLQNKTQGDGSVVLTSR